MDNLTRDNSGFRLGRTPARAEDHKKIPKLGAFLTPALPEPPDVVDYLSGMSSIPMLGNDRYGCCVIAAVAHFIQGATAAQGNERVFTEDEVLAVYSEVTGFRKDDPATDQGTNVFDALTWWKRNTFYGFELDGFVSVNARSWRAQRQAQWLLGGALIGVDLPLVAQRQDVWRLEMGLDDKEKEPGGWGGHMATSQRVVMTTEARPFFTGTSWGREQGITSTYWDCGYVAEVIVPLLKGWEAPPAAGTGFDHEGLRAAMRTLGKAVG